MRVRRDLPVGWRGRGAALILADDHLEIALRNTGTTDLGGFEVFCSITDSRTGAAESYYLRLPDSFTIAPSSQRVAHFDNSGAPDQFPVNTNSLYYVSQNPRVVSVTISAAGAAVQTATVTKAAGGAETGN